MKIEILFFSFVRRAIRRWAKKCKKGELGVERKPFRINTLAFAELSASIASMMREEEEKDVFVESLKGAHKKPSNTSSSHKKRMLHIKNASPFYLQFDPIQASVGRLRLFSFAGRRWRVEVLLRQVRVERGDSDDCINDNALVIHNWVLNYVGLIRKFYREKSLLKRRLSLLVFFCYKKIVVKNTTERGWRQKSSRTTTLWGCCWRYWMRFFTTSVYESSSRVVHLKRAQVIPAFCCVVPPCWVGRFESTYKTRNDDKKVVKFSTETIQLNDVDTSTAATGAWLVWKHINRIVIYHNIRFTDSISRQHQLLHKHEGWKMFAVRAAVRDSSIIIHSIR